ncbi:type II secretion system GspH family protein [Anaerovorax odorimutans]|uniref:Type II secretion system GspH family protein n=1 Tax=Anaerovorax odorimutans TaxID=109327 RepID=A0ABT1RS32_9FIRM|nr:type II secretion system protein [Anaerovorax odorimutans]MCQ4638013.1 type II secretion system GspH family protein [Anaerovorax odorimutans]
MNNKKGFTLIELIVAMSVAAIFMVCVVALISPSTKIFNRTEDSSDARLLAESLLEEIRHEANLSTSLTAGATDEKGNGHINIDEKVIAVDKEGFLVRTNASGGDSQKLFDDKFYKNKTVGMTAANVKNVDNCVDMTLKIYSDGRELYSLDSRLKPVLGKKVTSVKGEPEGASGDSDGTGKVEITTNKEWAATSYVRGDIIDYNGILYAVVKGVTVHKEWVPLGPDWVGVPDFIKVTDKVWRKKDIGNWGRLWDVQPGDQFVDDDGTLYIYVLSQFDPAGAIPPPSTWWAKVTEECYKKW